MDTRKERKGSGWSAAVAALRTENIVARYQPKSSSCFRQRWEQVGLARTLCFCTTVTQSALLVKPTKTVVFTPKRVLLVAYKCRQQMRLLAMREPWLAWTYAVRAVQLLVSSALCRWGNVPFSNVCITNTTTGRRYSGEHASKSNMSSGKLKLFFINGRVVWFRLGKPILHKLQSITNMRQVT